MMNTFHEVQPQDFCISPFAKIGTEWMLIGAEHEGRVNAMTASWGGLGVLWGKNVAFVFIRQTRFTKSLVDAADGFSLTFFDRPEHAAMLGYMGKASGRDEDKIAHAGLTVVHEEKIPYFAEARTVLICRKLSRHFLSPEGFLDAETDSRYYPDHNYHDMYVAEVEKILIRD